MRIGIITIGSRGDVQPYIALGKGFKRAGYEVRLLTHGAFADAARDEGLDFADLGVDPRTMGAGLRAGLPSLIVPFIGDQFFWGRQICERGLVRNPLSKST